MIAADLALALDPVLLAERAGIAPDPWQARLLRSTAREMILLCSRQAGKSTVSALLALHEALYNPGSLTLLLAPALRQSQELFRKVKDAYDAIGETASAIEEESALRVELANGSRVLCLPGHSVNVRGYSGVGLLVVDEAAWVLDPLYHSIRPMLAVSGGRLILLSTAFAKQGFFFHEWTEGGPTWERILVPAADCPRIPADWLEQERRRLPASVFAREYQCVFGELEGAVFDYEIIQAALDPEVKPLW